MKITETIIRTIFLMVVSFSFLCHAQKSTELFIPIGKSPGLSAQGKTVQGTVTKIEGDTVFLGNTQVLLNSKTKIFLDRSEVKKTNTVGTRDHIKVGEFVEAYLSEWIKIRSK